MSYVALYREWRPQKFSDIVGQVHVSQTLENAITLGRIAHAYLFCGPRGTGKTTTAKVLAKALNCLEPVGSEPCNECENCNRITNGLSMDVMEIDAASNRGIDEIRDLREKVKFSPTEGNYRIYIIDEVHMLTTEAFNALLKTLEEPPEHVIFILATTEPHKIPNTILSRCQRFDFKRIRTTEIIERLRNVCDELKIETDEETLNLLAKAADGGLRDALSILDQCIAFGGQKVTVEEVNIVLGTVNQDILFEMTDCFVNNDTTAALFLVEEIVNQGKDLRQFSKDLTEHLRNIMLLQVSDNPEELIPAADHILNMLKEQADRLNKDAIIKLLNIFSSTEREIKWSNQPRLNMEIAIIEACSKEAKVTTEDLLKRIEHLEEVIAGQKEVQINTNQINQNNVNIIKKKTEKRERNNSKEDKKPESKEIETKEIEHDNTEISIKLEKIQNSWQDVMESLKNKKRTAHAFLIEGQPLAISGHKLVLGFEEDYAFHKENIEKKENKQLIENIIKDIFGEEIKLECIFLSEYESISNKQVQESASEEEDPIVQGAIRLFGEEVIEIND